MRPGRKKARLIVYVGTAIVLLGMAADVWAGNPWLAIGLGTGFSYGLFVLLCAVFADRKDQRS